MLTFSCPACKKRLKVKDELKGKKVRCSCGQRIAVPELMPTPEPEPSPTVTVAQTLPVPMVAAPPAVIAPAPILEIAPAVQQPPVFVNRNLTPCPACNTSVSRQALRCPSCGHILRRAQRGLFGQLFKWAFILFNLYMAYVMFTAMSATSRMMRTADSEAAVAGTAIGAGLGIGVIIFLWVAGDIVLGLFVLFTRPRE